jgi:hypothetical protein
MATEEAEWCGLLNGAEWYAPDFSPANWYILMTSSFAWFVNGGNMEGNVSASKLFALWGSDPKFAQHPQKLLGPCIIR